jgi:tetratricopeptide (TPR) repeat protein
MKTLFIIFFIGLCCFLSACNLHISDDQVEKGKKVAAIKPDSSVVEVTFLPDGSILADGSTTVRDEGRGIPVGRAEIYKNLGASYLEQGELDKAIVEFKKAIQVNPRFVEAHYLLADVYSVKGEGLLSRTFLEKAMALEGSYIIDTRVTEKRIPSPPQYIFPAPEFLQGPIKRIDAPHR